MSSIRWLVNDCIGQQRPGKYYLYFFTGVLVMVVGAYRIFIASQLNLILDGSEVLSSLEGKSIKHAT